MMVAQWNKNIPHQTNVIAYRADKSASYQMGTKRTFGQDFAELHRRYLHQSLHLLLGFSTPIPTADS